MLCFLSVRTLRPGAWDAFRRAWEPREWPEGFIRAYHLRDPQNPDRVVSFGLFEGELSDVERLRGDPAFEAVERERQAAMGAHVASAEIDGIFEVIDEVRPPGRS